MESLGQYDSLIVQQKKEMLEIFTGFETKNRYVVKTQDGCELYYAAEVANSWLLRNFLQSLRPFTLEIMNKQQQAVLDYTKQLCGTIPHLPKSLQQEEV